MCTRPLKRDSTGSSFKRSKFSWLPSRKSAVNGLSLSQSSQYLSVFDSVSSNMRPKSPRTTTRSSFVKSRKAFLPNLLGSECKSPVKNTFAMMNLLFKVHSLRENASAVTKSDRVFRVYVKAISCYDIVFD